MTHLGDAAQDAERWWRAYRLAENDKADELRERAEGGRTSTPGSSWPRIRTGSISGQAGA